MPLPTPPQSTFSLVVTRSSPHAGDSPPIEVFAVRDSQPASAREVHLDLGVGLQCNGDGDGTLAVTKTGTVSFAGSVAYNVVYAATDDEKSPPRRARRTEYSRRPAASTSTSSSDCEPSGSTTSAEEDEDATSSRSNLDDESGTASNGVVDEAEVVEGFVELERPPQAHLPTRLSPQAASPPLHQSEVTFSAPEPQSRPHCHSRSHSQPRPALAPRRLPPRWKVTLILRWMLLRRFLRSVWRKLRRLVLRPFLRRADGEDGDDDGSSTLTDDVDLEFESMCDVDLESQFGYDSEKFDEEGVEMCVLGGGAAVSEL